MFKVPNPFEGMQRRLSKGFQRISDAISSIGSTPMKSFRNAVLSGDEDKALEIYTSEKNGNSLQVDMHPSLPFSSRKFSDETPLHLVTIMALNRLFDILINKGGCPNTPNKKDQTCLHSVCSRSDNSDLRYELLERIIDWRPQAVANLNQMSNKSNNKCIPGTDTVSVNHVDIDGNSAIHYAAYNGLLKCVRKLISLGAIISIVNKLQMTCCEMADEGEYKDLANMLELALVFQPEDANMIQYNESNVLSHEGRPCILMLDTDVMQRSDELNKYIDSIITEVCDSINTSSKSGKHPGISRSHTEVLLNMHSWDALKVIDEYANNYINAVKAAYLIPSLNFSAENKALNEVSDDRTTQSEYSMIPEPPKDSNEQSELGVLPPPVPFHVSNDKSSIIASEAVVDEFCTICGDGMRPTSADITDDMKLSISCLAGHSFCQECWSTNCSLQVKQEGVYCLKCPGFKCGEIITDEDLINKILPDPDTRRKFNEQRAAHVVDCKASLRWCPAKDCDCILNIKDCDTRYINALKVAHSKENGSSSKKQEREIALNLSILCLSQSVVCNRGHAICLTCNSEAHSPCPCSDWQRWLQRVNEESKIIGTSSNGDDIATALWVTANTKKCPRCTTPIEKDEGCNHMNCRKCRYEFCWICMQDWTLHSNATGGFFQCNRFVANNNNGDSSDANDESLARMLASEIGGSAQMETLRMRTRGQKMARFIHHFTRFKAHGESVLMEARMYQETVTRISSELQDALTENSNWLQGELVPIPDAKCENSLEFLHLGFIELIKCRNILKGSFAFAFYAFEKETETSDDILDPHMLIFEQLGITEFVENRRYSTPKSKSKKDAIPVNPYTHTLLRRKRTFEFLQSDLEMLTEMLSDVVARRRLRASKNQIMEASRAARNKRVEFEDMILSCITNDNESNITPSSSERHNRRNVPNRRHVNESQSTRSLAWQSLYGGDLNDDELDIAALISELEAPSRPNNRVASNDIDNESESINEVGVNADANALASQTRSLIRALEDNLENVSVSSTSPRNRTREPDAVTVRTVDSPRIRAIRDYRTSRGQSVRTPTARNTEQPSQPSSRSSNASNSPSNSDRNTRQSDWRQILLDSSQDEENLSAYTVSNIVSRAAEEEALNRAILLSLQAPSPANVAPDFVASEVAVEALLSMGFERDQVLIALRDSNNDVESAANRLLA